MTSVLYVVSLNPREGKTALSAALASRWQAAGKEIEYLKPVAVSSSPDEAAPQDEEFQFARQVLGLPEVEQPHITITSETADDPSIADAQKKVRSLCEEASKGRELVLLEGPDGVRDEGSAKWVSTKIAEAVGAKVILVTWYSRDINVEDLVSVTNLFGDSVVGSVVNGISELNQRVVSTEFVPALKEAGLKVIGAIPEMREMVSITVQGLVEKLNGRYALQFNGGDDLIGNIMVGANVVDAPGYPAGPIYYGTKDDKVVIAKGDRPDFHWSALDTDTRCVILTGNQEPIPYVIEKAKETKIPLVVVETDTLATLDALERVLATPRLDQAKKLEKLQSLVQENLDLNLLDRELKI